MKTKEEIYWYMVENHNVYLPTYQLEKLAETIINQPPSFGLINDLDEAAENLKNYVDPLKGSYTNGENKDKFLKNCRKSVLQIEVGTYKVVETFPSLYSAGKKFKGGHGNISRAIKIKGIAYGFLWMER